MKQLIKKICLLLSAATLFISCSDANIISNESTKVTNNVKKLDFNEVLENLTIGFEDNFNSSVLVSNAISNAEILNQEVKVIIELDEDTTLDNYFKSGKTSYQNYYDSLDNIIYENNLITSQANLASNLLEEGLISKVDANYTILLNGFSATTTYGNLDKIKSFAKVKEAYFSVTYAKPEATINETSTNTNGIYENDTKYDGSNTIVAILDSGFDYNHEAFDIDIVNPAISKDEVANLLSKTKAYKIEDNELTIDDVYLSDKIPFAYDYAEEKADVYPISSDHGTHVSGIIGGKSDVITGIAPQTQFAWLKVFDDETGSGSTDSIIEALEDAILLGVDAINLSLGSLCGYSSEASYQEDVSATENKIDQIYNKIEETGISLITAAGNEYSSGYQSTYGSNLASNPESGSISAPASYNASLAVASINSNLSPYFLNEKEEIFFTNVYDSKSKEHKFDTELFNKIKDEGVKIKADGSYDLEYVTIPGNGEKEDYTDLDVKGKIVLVKRGIITFEEKVKNAYEAGAFAVLIYNNVAGTLKITIGENNYLPTALITLDAGEKLASKDSGILNFSSSYQAGPFMSNFSSWGPLADLTLKPEITACGGNVYSSVLGNKYETMSGTSMATPNICGITIIIREYVQEKWPNLSQKEVATRVNQLLMSTAEICLNEVGNPYSPRKQGAGIASLLNSITTSAYLSVDGINKTKLELKDDPSKTGVYNCTFNINNIADHSVTYDISNITMSETVYDSEGVKTVAESSYILNPSQIVETSLAYNNGKVSVPANSSGSITVTLTLSEEDKNYLDTNFENGMYVEGYITLTPTDTKEVSLNIPYLAFYGDWLAAPMFDVSYYDVQNDEIDDSIASEDKTKAAMYATTAYGKYLEYYIVPLGSYVYEYDEGYEKIAASTDKAAISYDEDSTIYALYTIYTGLLRGAKELTITISNSATGEIYFEKTTSNNRKALYNGQTIPYYDLYDFYMLDEEEDSIFSNNTQFTIKMVATLDYENGENVNNNTFEMSFWCDYEAPSVDSATYLKEYDEESQKDKYYLELEVSDNRYVQSIRPCTLINGSLISLTDNPIPVYQEEANQKTTVKFEITDYLNDIANSDYPDTIFYIINDYALNSNIYYTALSGLDYSDLAFTTNTITITAGEEINLNEYVNYDNVMLSGLVWTSSNEKVVTVSDGICYGLAKGNATITGKSITFGTTLQLNIKVKKGTLDTSVAGITYTGYEPLFVFDDDYEYSDIGYVGINYYMPSDNYFALYPSESIKLSYEINPWYYDNTNVKVIYSSSDDEYVRVSQDGIVTAIKETEDDIEIKATVYENSKETSYEAIITISVKSPFITSGTQLVYYKGWGGIVEVPSDLGIQYIYEYAFSHYQYQKEDDDEYAEAKPLGDPCVVDGETKSLYATPITKIILPSGVKYIMSYAFYGLVDLEEVVINNTYKDDGSIDEIIIYTSAFENCTSLKKVNLNNVTKIENYAFKNTSLSNINGEDANGNNLANVLTIGKEAFLNTKLTKIDLSTCRYVGEGAFEGTSLLKEVKFHEDTPLAKRMFKNSGVTSLTLYQANIPEEFASGATALTSLSFISNNLTIKKNAFKDIGITTLSLLADNVYLDDNSFEGAEFKTLELGENTIFSLNMAPFANVENFNKIILNNNKNYQVINNLLLSKDGKEIYLAPTNCSINIPSYVLTINESAFNGNNSKEINIPSTVKLVKAAAFASSDVTTLTITNSTTFEEYVFYNCTNLKEVNGLDTLDTISSYMFSKCALEEINIKDNATISNYAFSENSKLNKLTLGSDVEVNDYAFYKSFNNNNSSANLNNATIGNYSFANTNLKVITSNKVTAVGDYAFSNNNKLTTIDLSNASLGKGIFSEDTNLKTVTLKDNIAIPSYIFNNCENLTTLNCNNIQSVGSYAFYNNKKFKDIDLSTATSIGNYSFYGNEALKTINLKKATSIGKYAFAENTSLTTVNLNEAITKINEGTFYNENSNGALTTINLDNITNFGDSCFYGNSNLVDVNLEKATKIEDYAFYNTSINNLDLPKATYVGAYAFCGVPIKNLTIPALVFAGECAFAEIKVVEINLPTSLETLSYGSFSSISNLTNFKVNGELNYTKSINNKLVWQVIDGVLYAYNAKGDLELKAYPCNNERETYTVIDNTTRIDDFAFYTTNESTSLKEIYLPSSLKTIGDGAFGGFKSLVTYHFASYEAPVLEGEYDTALQGLLYNLSSSTLTNKANELYHIATGELYNMYYYYYPFYYANFYDYVGFARGLTMYYPSSSTGYDSKIYNAYFENQFVEKAVADEITTSAIEALELIEDINIVDETNKELVIDAYNKYNLITSDEQKALISKELINKLTNLYNQILDLDYPKLTQEEIAKIANYYTGSDSNNKQYTLTINNDGSGTINELSFTTIRHNNDSYQIEVNNGDIFTFNLNEDGSLTFNYYDTKVQLIITSKPVTPTKKGCKSTAIPSFISLGIILLALYNLKKLNNIKGLLKNL